MEYKLEKFKGGENHKKQYEGLKVNDWQIYVTISAAKRLKQYLDSDYGRVIVSFDKEKEVIALSPTLEDTDGSLKLGWMIIQIRLPKELPRERYYFVEEIDGTFYYKTRKE